MPSCYLLSPARLLNDKMVVAAFSDGINDAQDIGSKNLYCSYVHTQIMFVASKSNDIAFHYVIPMHEILQQSVCCVLNDNIHHSQKHGTLLTREEDPQDSHPPHWSINLKINQIVYAY